jgi:hypothetical protein
MELSAKKVLSDDEVQKLCNVFDCGSNELLARKLQPFADAAVNEYFDMLLQPRGKKDQIVKDRLFYVIQAAGFLPDELEVKEWTGLDMAKTRSLIKDVLVSKKHEIKTLIDEATRKLLNTATENGDDVALVTTQVALIEFLNDQIVRRDPSAGEIARVRGRRGVYKMSRHEYNILLELVT